MVEPLRVRLRPPVAATGAGFAPGDDMKATGPRPMTRPNPLPWKATARRAALATLLAAAWPAVASPEARFEASEPFVASSVVNLARNLARAPFAAPEQSVPAALGESAGGGDGPRVRQRPL